MRRKQIESDRDAAVRHAPDRDELGVEQSIKRFVAEMTADLATKIAEVPRRGQPKDHAKAKQEA